jgi:hypothetical protein
MQQQIPTFVNQDSRYDTLFHDVESMLCLILPH